MNPEHTSGSILGWRSNICAVDITWQLNRSVKGQQLSKTVIGGHHTTTHVCITTYYVKSRTGETSSDNYQGIYGSQASTGSCYISTTSESFVSTRIQSHSWQPTTTNWKYFQCSKRKQYNQNLLYLCVSTQVLSSWSRNYVSTQLDEMSGLCIDKWHRWLGHTLTRDILQSLSDVKDWKRWKSSTTQM